MDSLPKRPNAPPSPPRRGSRHVSPPTVQRPGPSSWEPAPRGRSPQSWDREPPRGRPMFRPRSRSRSRSFDYDYDFQPRRTPPPHLSGSRLPRRAWERSRSRSPPPTKTNVPCKYFSRPTGCDKGARCRFLHQRPRSRSFSRSRSYSRSPPPMSRSRSPPPRGRRGESPMFIPRSGLRSPPSLLQRLGPVAAPMRQPSPPRSGPVSRDVTEPLEEGEERSPGRKSRKSRGGRVRKREGRERANWDSFVAADGDREDYLSGEENRRIAEPRRGRSRSRSPATRTRSPSHKSRSGSPENPPAALASSVSGEKRSHRHSPQPRSPSPSRSARSQGHTPHSHGRSQSRSRSRTPSPRLSRSRSHSPYRRSRHERESWAERGRKNASPAPSPGAASATVAAPEPTPAIPTGPRWRASGNQPPAPPIAPRNTPGATRGGLPPTGPRGDREPPRGPRNMMISGANTGPSVTSVNTGPGWDRPQSSFQSYLAAVQNKLVERESKKKGDDDVVPSSADTNTVPADSNAMDIDVKEEPTNSATGSHLNTPAPEHTQGGQITSPAHSDSAQAQHSAHVSPSSGSGIPLPLLSGSSHPNAQTPGSQSHPLPQAHSLPLPPRPRSPPRAPRSPPRGPRATRGLPEKPKAMAIGGQEFSRERDRDRDSVERGARDRNGAGTSGAQLPESERKVHALPTNPARRPRVPVIRTTKREVLFPDLEKEITALEEQRVRLANEHLPHEIALRQSVHELTLSNLDWQAAEDRRIMTESVLEAMVKGTGLVTTVDL